MLDNELINRLEHHKKVITDLEKKYRSGRIERAEYLARVGRQIDNTMIWFRKTYPNISHYTIYHICEQYGVNLLSIH